MTRPAFILFDGALVFGRNRSQPITPNDQGQVSFDVEGTGTVTGTFTVEYSNRKVPDSGDVGWRADPLFTAVNPSAAVITAQVFPIGNIAVKHARLVFNLSSGSGTMTVRGAA